jgi:hypothetical protein
MQTVFTGLRKDIEKGIKAKAVVVQVGYIPVRDNARLMN